MEHPPLLQLEDALVDSYDDHNALIHLCRHFRVDYTGPSTNLSILARDLVSGCVRTGQFAALVAYLRQDRPQADWDFLDDIDESELRAELNRLVTVGATPRLHQLPAPPADFTGREDELAALESAITEGGATVAALRGVGGVGKTALALVLAQRLKGGYPDAQIVLDLQGVSPTPVAPGGAMAYVIRAFHPTEQLPEDESALAALYRSLLDGKRCLLLMDNAADRAQVEPLMPPPGSLLLVTSRQVFVLPGLHALDLDQLPDADAETLLLRIAPRIGDSAAELAAHCGSLPLALRITASALAERVTLRVERYLARLRDSRESLDEVEATLRLSYDLISPELQCLWRHLSVFPGSFALDAAAAVWAIETDDAADALDELARYSLVQWDAEGERYYLHDVVRACAAHLCGIEGERAGTQRRHAEHYVEVLRIAEKLYRQGGDATLQALSLLDLERANVEAGHAWAAACTDGGGETARLLHAYAVTAPYCLSLRLHSDEWIAWLEAAANVCQQVGDPFTEGAVLSNLGVAYSRRGEVRRAIACYEESLARARAMGDRWNENANLGSLGIACFALGEVGKAIGYYDEALASAREVSDRRNKAIHTSNLGTAYCALGTVGKGIACHEEALGIAREVGDRPSEGVMLGNLGIAYSDLGEVERAVEHYKEALGIAREVGDRRNEGAMLGSLGNAYRALEDVATAIEYHEQAAEIARAIGARPFQCRLRGDLGNDYAQQGELREAHARYQEALQEARELGDRPNQAVWLGNLGLVLGELGQPEDGIQSCGQALTLAREMGLRGVEATHSWNLGQLVRDTDPDRALALMQPLIDYYRAIGHRDAETHAAYVDQLRSGETVRYWPLFLDAC